MVTSMSDIQSVRPDELLLVGEVINVVGLRGDVRLRLISTQPQFLAENNPMLYSADGKRSFRLRRLVHYKNDIYTATLGGIATRDLAEAMRGTELYMRQTDIEPLGADEYFLHDLVDMTVVDAQQQLIGTVREVINTGASDVLVITRIGKPDALVPMVKAFVSQLDLTNKRLVVTPIPGLIEDPTAD
jgi:16S rRNA processing protein RimM